MRRKAVITTRERKANDTVKKENKKEIKKNQRIQIIVVPARDMQNIGLYRCPVPGNKASTLSKVHIRLPYAVGYRWRNIRKIYKNLNKFRKILLKI